MKVKDENGIERRLRKKKLLHVLQSKMTAKSNGKNMKINLSKVIKLRLIHCESATSQLGNNLIIKRKIFFIRI